MAIPIQVVMDCADPDRLASFWAAALGYKLQDPPKGFTTWEDWLAEQGIPESEWNSASAVVDPEGNAPRLFFQRVPEPKQIKNRVHLDLSVSGGRDVPIDERRDEVEKEAERLTAHGATRVDAIEQRGEYWIVMQDPEGNEFCLQ